VLVSVPANLHRVSRRASYWAQVLTLLAAGGVFASACAVSKPTASAPTAVLRASAPANLQPEPTATLTPHPTKGPTLTPDPLGTVTAAQTAELLGAYPSPDERWLAEVLAYDCVPVGEGQQNAYQELRLTDTTSGEARTVDSQLINCDGLGAYGLAGWFWSANSRFFYYTNASTGVPDGCGYFTSPYLRADTTDLSAELLGMGALAPDQRKLAAWWEGEGEVRQDGWLAIWDVEGELLGIGRIPPPILIPGPIAWSPEGQAVAFLTSENYCPLGLTALGRMQLDIMIPIVVLQSADPSFAGLAWQLADRVELTDEQGGRWSYNFATRDLLPETP